MIRDGFDHEIRAVANIGDSPEHNGTDAQSRDKLDRKSDVSLACVASDRAEKGQVSGRAVQESRQRPGRPINPPAVRLPPTSRNLSSAGIIVAKMPKNKTATSMMGRKLKFIGLMHSPAGEKVGSDGREDHDAFPEQRWQRDYEGCDDHCQEYNVPQSRGKALVCPTEARRGARASSAGQ
jgi:hypothetical protein